MPLVGDYATSDACLAFMQYDENWRIQRRACSREMNVNNAKQYQIIQEREGVVLAQGFLRSPKDIWPLAFRFSGSIGLGGKSDHVPICW